MCINSQVSATCVAPDRFLTTCVSTVRFLTICAEIERSWILGQQVIVNICSTRIFHHPIDHKKVAGSLWSTKKVPGSLWSTKKIPGSLWSTKKVPDNLCSTRRFLTCSLCTRDIPPLHPVHHKEVPNLCSSGLACKTPVCVKYRYVLVFCIQWLALEAVSSNNVAGSRMALLFHPLPAYPPPPFFLMSPSHFECCCPPLVVLWWSPDWRLCSGNSVPFGFSGSSFRPKVSLLSHVYCIPVIGMNLHVRKYRVNEVFCLLKGTDHLEGGSKVYSFDPYW